MTAAAPRGTAADGRSDAAAIRVGVTGLESSHVDTLIDLLNVEGGCGDTRVTVLCGDDDERTRSLAARGGIGRVVDDPAALADIVDAVVVCDRRGSTHRRIAEPLLARGLPVLVDKPFAAGAEDARAMVAAAQASGALLTSYSSLRFSTEVEGLAAAAARLTEPYTVEVHGPADPDSPYDGIYFYLSHHADIAARLTGDPIDDVRVARAGTGWTVAASSGPNRIVLRFEPNPASRAFAVGIDAVGPMRTIADAALAVGFRAFLGAVAATGPGMPTTRPSVPTTDLIRPVLLLDAVAAGLAAL